MQIIDGKQIAQNVKDGLRKQIIEFTEKGMRNPELVVVLVGENPASLTYVRNKEKACEAIGMATKTVRWQRKRHRKNY